MKLIHSTDQYRIYEDIVSMEDSTDTANVLKIEYGNDEEIILTFAFGNLVMKQEKTRKPTISRRIK
jgi:hypothetical protein